MCFRRHHVTGVHKTPHKIHPKQHQERHLADKTSASQHHKDITLSEFKHKGIERPFKVASSRADTAILSHNLSNKKVKKSECPNKEVVKCVKGLVVSGGGKTCTDACDGECCIYKFNGEDTSMGFTGSVSKDGKSCIRWKICHNTNIDNVCDGCHGSFACL